MKNIYVTLLVLGFAIGVGLFVFDYHMQSRWDHHIKTDLGFYDLQKQGEERAKRLDETELDVLAKKYQIPRTLEIIKQDNEYFLVGSPNIKLDKNVTNKSIVSDLKFSEKTKWMVFHTDIDDTTIEIFTNLYELTGCRGIKSNFTGNLQGQQTLTNGDLLKYRGQAPVYENFVQRYLCKFYRYYP